MAASLTGSTAAEESPPEPLLASLEAGSTIRVLAPGDHLLRQGDPAAAIYKVESGRLRLIRCTVDDHLVILHTARRDDFFARCRRRCAVEGPGLSKRIVMEAMRADPALAEAFIARLARQLQELRARMELRNVRSARDRVLQYLWLRAGTYGRSIPIEGQLQDIASEIGMTREALYRTLAALETESCLTRTETAILHEKSDSP